MNRRFFLRGTAALATPLAIAPRLAGQAGAARMDEARSESARRIRKATVAAMAMERRDWEQGILAQAMLEAGLRDETILLTRAAIVQRSADGRLGVVIAGGPTDSAMGGTAYAQAADWTGDKQLREAVDGLMAWIRVKAPRGADGTLYHVFNAPEVWSDGFNGAPPFLASMGFHDEALAQIEGFKKRLWNPEKKLLAHIWDDGKQKLTDGNFWGSGNGWAAAGLARVIRSLPAARRADRERHAAFQRAIVDGCLAYRRADGLFHDVIDQPSSFVETNLAQMLAYAVYEGVRGGWLPASYREDADGLRAAARAKMDSDGLVQGVCGAPNFDRQGLSTEGQAFCILMEVAGSRMES